jgi:hypothetical protein
MHTRYGRVCTTLYTLSLTPSGVIGKEDDLFIMDYDSKYLEYYFRIENDLGMNAFKGRL